jgi:GrpB-like predicted nucleotidyltransferase (UPF0157 family)
MLNLFPRLSVRDGMPFSHSASQGIHQYGRQTNMRDKAPPAEETFTSEERLLAATIGPTAPLNGAILVVPYDPAWKSLYATLEAQIRRALGEKLLVIEHVGSTSVPGLSAKPVIDVAVVVPNSADEGSYVPSLQEAGYVLRIREPDWFEHRMLKAPAIEANVHVFSEGCEEIERMLAFRNHLRKNEADRELYGRTKKALAARTWKHVQNYADAKSEVVRQILNRAAAGGSTVLS